jgi:hypothetical protein
VSKDDNGSEGSGPTDAASGNSIPKLTVGQRILTALPNLQRQPKAPAPRAPDGGRPPAFGSGSGSDKAETVEPDEVLAPGSNRSTTARRRDSSVGPAASRPQRGTPSGMSKEELTEIIKRLDDRERFLALVSAPLGIVVGLLLTIGAIHFNPPVHHKNHVSTGFILFEGGARVVLAGILVLATVTRRRSFVAFALLFLGTSMGFPFALPFWALGIWLIFRVFKWQRELTAITGPVARSRPEPRPRGGGSDAAARRRAEVEARRRARAERVSARSGGRGARNKKAPEPAGPPPSKRYTPPKTIRPKPPLP